LQLKVNLTKQCATEEEVQLRGGGTKLLVVMLIN
jgi:hypothetical protein